MATLLSDLTAGAIQLADMVGNNFVTAAQWRLWCGDDAVRELHGIVSTAYSDTFFKTLTFTMTGAAAGVYTLPTDFMRMRGLDLNPDTPSRRTIHRFNFGERNGKRRGPVDFNNWRRREYRIVSRTTMIIEPVEQAAGPYKLYYVPIPPVLVADGDSLQTELVPFREYIFIVAAIKALGKQEKDTADLKERRDLMRADIMASAATDENEADTIVDVEDGLIDWPGPASGAVGWGGS